MCWCCARRRSFRLTLIHARTIGLMTMIDTGKKDHKIIAVATQDPEFNTYREAEEMPPHRSAHAAPFLSGLQTAGRQSGGSGQDPACGGGLSHHQRCLVPIQRAAAQGLPGIGPALILKKTADFGVRRVSDLQLLFRNF